MPGYSHGQLLKAVVAKLRCKPSVLSNVRIVRRSVDARRGSPRVVIVVEVDVKGKRPSGKTDVEVVHGGEDVFRPAALKKYRGLQPVVVGAGPAGLMAAFSLAESGMKPLLIERGEDASSRSNRVESFWKDGVLDGESNVLYGEGGAGLFSDGKLTSRSKDRPRVRRVLEIFVSCGASPDILIDAEPHIGSDVLQNLLPALRQRIVEMGGEVRFGAKLDTVMIESGALRGVVISGEEVRTDCCVLATGHSARDVYAMLADVGVPLEAKPFAVGVRVEIPQKRIDVAQWGGSFASLGSASFRMTRREEDDARACYTFCMCPGGLVISCASSPGLITSNGMSLSKRDRPFGNAAFLVPVGADDFSGCGGDGVNPVLAGIEFQRGLEAAAFAAGGSDYGLPAQRLIEFLEGSTPSELPENRSCARARPVQLRGLLPEFVENTLRSAMPKMLRGMRGLLLEETLLYASETRSSSPVRIMRGNDGQSSGVRGLYPCGEGAGYAGGIVSSGIDGLRCGENVERGTLDA